MTDPTPERSGLLLVLGLILCSVACQSSGYRLRYNPSVAEVVLAAGPDAPEVARVLVSVPGALRSGEAKDGLFEIQVRLRIENRSDEQIEVDLAEWLLVDADLEACGTGRVVQGAEPGTIVRVSAGEAAHLDLRFSLPASIEHPRDMNLDGFNLHGVLQVGGESWPLGVTFTREPLVLYTDPGPYPGYWRGSFGFGYYGYPGYYGGYHAHH